MKPKYSAILTCICELAKYAIAIKLSDMVMAITTTNKLLNHVLLKYNIPSMLVSDQGPAFTSQLFSEITKLFKIRKIATTPYRPNSNVHENPNNWVDHLDSALFAYSNSIHTSTNFSPHELLFSFRIPLLDKIIKRYSNI